MKTIKILIAALILMSAADHLQAQSNPFYYAVEIDGVLCGYAIGGYSFIDYDGEQMIETNDTVYLLLKALGQDMNMNIISRHVLHPDSYKVVLNESTLDYGKGNVVSTKTEVFPAYALRNESATGRTDTILLKGNVIFDNPLSSPYLLKDFAEGGETIKTYQIYDYLRGHIADQEYTFLGEEEMSLAGLDMQVLAFSIKNIHDGTNIKTWVNKADGMTVQFEIMNRFIYLADHSVIKSVKTVDLDNTIFGKVDKSIPNFMDMTYLKVKVDIKTAGEEVTVESLNFPGQKFKGTVVENHIQGIFEIEPLWYEGRGAPDFPPDFSGDETLVKFLEPEIFIESDDHELIAMATDITAGSADSWEAAVRLSEWVGKEIAGAVPGGTTAINTYHTREGECGSHSRLLTAFCRAVGIPSRLSIGCMYSTWYGGSFGQHAWTEVYMGDEIGWVAVDATILEYNYVDAGHIKLGISSSFNPNSMEILDYRIGDGDGDAEGIAMPDEFIGIIGPYTNPDNRNVLEAIYDGSGISVDIMGRMILALKDADEKGRMYAKLSEAIYFVFPENESGEIDKMIIVERLYAMKNLEEEVVAEQDVPVEMKALLGKYMVMQIQKEFIVRWDSGHLAMLLPDMEKNRPLEKTDDENRWRDPVDKKEYLFSINNDGSVSGMNIFVSSALSKGATIAWTLEQTIKKEGLYAAEKQFNELWDNRAVDLEHAESDMNNLGYKYLGNDQIDEAILIFRLNTESFPQSFNVYGSYAEALKKKGDKENAILNFQKSVELNPDNEHGKEMLEELKTANE